jgi:hypothetical protein
VILTLLALAVLLPSSAFARTSFLCRMDGQVRHSCCCPSKAKQHDAAPESTIRAQCCCSSTTVAPAASPPAAHETKAAPAPDVVAIIAPAPYVAPRIERAAVRPRALAPPDSDHRSLFARHCALLL